MLGHSRLDTTQIYTHVSIKALTEVHARTHPHGRLGTVSDAEGSEETEETAFPGASEKVKEKPAMITVPCPQPSDYQVTEAGADEPFRPEDGDDFEGGAPKIAPRPRKPRPTAPSARPPSDRRSHQKSRGWPDSTINRVAGKTQLDSGKALILRGKTGDVTDYKYKHQRPHSSLREPDPGRICDSLRISVTASGLHSEAQRENP